MTQQDPVTQGEPMTDPGKYIVRENKLRHCLNLIQIMNFVFRHTSRIVIFLATHPNLPEHMTPAEAWSIMDASSCCSSPGMFWYTEGMPVIITQNVHVSLGISNGKEGKASGFILDPASKVYQVKSESACEFHIVDRPLACLLIEVHDPKHDALEELPHNVIPVYPLMAYVTYKKSPRSVYNFRRFQIPCTPGFAITDYRAQGKTFDNITIDFTTKARNLSQHKIFCFLYVALSRCRTGSEVSLLTPLSIGQFLSRPSNLLSKEMERLQGLAHKTEEMLCCGRTHY